MRSRGSAARGRLQPASAPERQAARGDDGSSAGLKHMGRPVRSPRPCALSSVSVLDVIDILEGNEPTELWLASDDAQRMLSDVERRMALYGRLHPRADPAHAPLLRALLAHEVAFRNDEDAEAAAPENAFENLYWCALLLAQLGCLEDVLPLWRAKHTNFDTGCSFDIQLVVVGAGVSETLELLSHSADPEAPSAAEYIAACRDAGQLDNLGEWLEFRRAYFG